MDLAEGIEKPNIVVLEYGVVMVVCGLVEEQMVRDGDDLAVDMHAFTS